MPQFFDKAGAPIPDAEVPSAIAEGRAFAAEPRVKVRAPDGTTGTMDVSQLRGSGYVPLTDAEIREERLHAERGTVGQQALTAGEGALRGATVGLSDVALTTALGRDYAEAADERKEENPITATVSTLGGALAPALVSGGAAEGVTAAKLGAEAAGEGFSLGKAALGTARAISAPSRAVARAGELVEHGITTGLKSLGYTGSSALSRVAGKAIATAAGGAVEGAAFGAGDVASESFLKGQPITAEALAGSIGRNALFGGVIGGAVTGLGEAGKEGLNKAARSIGKERLEQFAAERAGKQLGQDWEKIGIKKSPEAAAAQKTVVGKDLLSYELKTGDNAGKTILQTAKNPTDILRGIGQAKEEIGAAREGVVSQLDEAIATRPDIAAAAAPDIGEYVARVKAEVTDVLRASTSPAKRRMANAVDREVAGLAERARPIEPIVGELGGKQAANEAAAPLTFADLLQSRRDMREAFQPAAPAGGGLPPPPPKSAVYLEKAERILADFIDQKASHALGLLGEDSGRFTELTRQLSSFATMEKIATKQVNRFAKNRSLSLTDHMMGLTAFLGAIGSGNFGGLATMGMGAAAAIANKMGRERGNAVLADIAWRIAQKDNVIDAAAHSLALSGDRFAKPAHLLAAPVKDFERSALAAESPGAEPSNRRAVIPLGATQLKANYEQARDRVRELQDESHQQAQLAHATAPFARDYPEAAASMSQQLLKTYQYLGAQLPTEHSSGSSLTPGALKSGVTPREMTKFLSKADAALNPHAVIQDMARGKIDDDAVTAIQQVFPEMFSQLRQKTIEVVAAKKEQLPYSRVVHLSALFGFAGDSSLDPARASALQKTIAEISQAPNASSPGTPGPTKKARPSSSRAASVGRSYALPGSKTPGSI